MALTDTEIRQAKPGDKPYKLYDREGLFLLVRPNSKKRTVKVSKLWRFKYQWHDRERLMAFGEYPEVSLAAARERVLEARKLLADGIDPMAQRKTEQVVSTAKVEAERSLAANTFRPVALQWHKWWSAGVDADTAAYILRRLENDVFPVLGNKHMNDIRAVDIRNLITAIESGKGDRRFKGKGARDVAQRQHGTISQIFRYAVVHELAERNPAADFKPSDVLKPRKTVHRAHIEPSDLPALLVAMDEFNGQIVWRYALQLMSMLFVRTNELLEAPLTEFDLDNARWTITAERMKMSRPHIVPLPHQAVAILRELFARSIAANKKFVFPGLNKQTENDTVNENTLLNALEEIGYKGVMTGHGYRGLARTILAENGFEKEHVELQLAHANDDKTDAAYNHAKYLQQRTELMQWWADYLDRELAKGRETKAA